MASLLLFDEKSAGKEIPLDREVHVIGKGSACDIVLPAAQVSKRHAAIRRVPGGHSIEDLNSTNGTRVGGRRIGLHRLKDGEVIQIYRYQLVYAGDVAPAGGSSRIVAELETTAPSTRTVMLARPEDKLGAILEIGRELTGALGLDAVLDRVLGVLLRIFPQAERAFFLFKEEGASAPTARAIRLRNPGPGASTISRTIYDHVTREGRAILCEDVAADGRFDASRSVLDARIRMMMCVPLLDSERRSVGILQIDTDGDGRFEQDDLDCLVAVAASIGMAVENARLHEREVRRQQIEQEARDAQAVQRALIPERCPALPGYEFWHDYEPARFVGGDYFDYRPLPGPGGAPSPRRWAVALGDVSGKGMPAALLMARLSSEVRLLAQAEPDPARLVERLNQGLCDTGSADKFVTFLLVVLDADRHELTVVNAGHMGPMIRRADGRIEVIGQERNGPPLGIIGGLTYEAVTAPIGPGEVAVLYTDGVNEAIDPAGREFGFDRLRRSLAGAAPGARLAGTAIIKAVHAHAAGREQYDDITLLCLARS